MENNKNVWIWGITCLVLSFVFNLFFLFSPWGISVLLFNVITIGAGYFALYKHPRFHKRNYLLLASLLIVLSIPYLRFDFFLFKFLNFFLMFGVYGLMLHNVLPMRLFKIIQLSLLGLVQPLGKINRLVVDMNSQSSQKQNNIKYVLLGLLCAVPLLFIVLPLLLSADAVFNSGMTSLFGTFDSSLIEEYIFRGIVWMGLLFYFYSRYTHQHPLKEVEILQATRKTWNLTFLNVFLLVIDCVYILFSYVQMSYLFFGKALPEGIVYSTYAREGFFQLAFVTFINILIIVCVNHLKENHISVNILLTITVGCTLIMTASAFYKMSMYEQAYGYTRLRLLVYLYLVAQVIGLIPLIIGIYKPHFKYLEIAALSVFIYYLGVSFINIDGFVTERNIGRMSEQIESDAFDYVYLDSLSADAIPAYVDSLDKMPVEAKDYLIRSIIKKYAYLDQNEGWYAYNLSREQLVKTYRQIDPDGVLLKAMEEDPWGELRESF